MRDRDLFGDGRGVRAGRIVPKLLHKPIVTAQLVGLRASPPVSNLGRARRPSPHNHQSSLAALELLFQLDQGGFEYGSMLWIRRNLKLLQNVPAGKLQAIAPLLFHDLFGSKRLAPWLGGRCRFFLLLLDRLALPSAGHNQIVGFGDTRRTRTIPRLKMIRPGSLDCDRRPLRYMLAPCGERRGGLRQLHFISAW